METQIHGHVAPGFERVRTQFERNFAVLGEVGASVAVHHRGSLVVDLWAGSAGDGRAWEERTMAPVFSVSKGIAAIVLTYLASRGDLRIDAPIAEVWPEFAQNGKAGVTLRHVLSHTAGLPWFDGSSEIVSFDSIEGWASRDHVEDCIARQAPLWEPGTQVAYHSFTYGWIADAVVRRATGRTIGEVLAQDLAGPLDADFAIGYRGDPGRVAELVPPKHISDTRKADTQGDAARAMFYGPEARPMWEIAGMPSYWALGGCAAGGVGNARGIARLYSLLTTSQEEGGLIPEASVAEHTREQFSDRDRAFGFWSRTGLGFGLATDDGISYGPFVNAAGFSGMGGALGFADRSRAVTFGYAMNQIRLETYGNVSTVAALLDALDQCVD
ncbi:serine hydrolase domain-containing protein [Nonomuraea cavernae]|uniref:serine hydrolase domain-containing protein n=1 Tax=Nonomuraea cavernae TaxID=2045107 RepID=UPI0033E9F1F8